MIVLRFNNVYVPSGCYWSSPFVRWQGSMAHLNSIPLAAETTKRALQKCNILPSSLDAIHLGITIPQKNGFYGQTWLSGLIGAPNISGPMISQACATSARVMATAASEIESNQVKNHTILAVTCDRTSNGPHLLYPNPYAPGGKADFENWVWDNFNYDPYAKNAMIQTAENVAKEEAITREMQEEATLLRYTQYNKALENNAEFLRRFMDIPMEIKIGKKTAILEGDEGVYTTSAEGLANLSPVIKDGTVTFGTQTHPADGNCGMILTTQENAQTLSLDKDFEIQVLSFGQARSEKGFMPTAPVPAANRALESAHLSISDITSFKLHNPFAVNDIYFSQKMDISIESVNNYGSSLVWGHPQAPTGMRLLIELIEELKLKNGGNGLFAGCSAGDSAASIVIKVSKN
ncbi:thiolase family protein [Candidatus Hodarchaeum mangrovi]